MTRRYARPDGIEVRLDPVEQKCPATKYIEAVVSCNSSSVRTYAAERPSPAGWRSGSTRCELTDRQPERAVARIAPEFLRLLPHNTGAGGLRSSKNRHPDAEHGMLRSAREACSRARSAPR